MGTEAFFETKAAVRTGPLTVTGDARQISLDGFVLHSSERIASETPVAIEIILFGPSSETVIKLAGVVREHRDDGMRIEFSAAAIELDGFIALKNVVMVNSSGGRKVIQEYMRYLRKHKLTDQQVGDGRGDSGPKP